MLTRHNQRPVALLRRLSALSANIPTMRQQRVIRRTIQHLHLTPLPLTHHLRRSLSHLVRQIAQHEHHGLIQLLRVELAHHDASDEIERVLQEGIRVGTQSQHHVRDRVPELHDGAEQPLVPLQVLLVGRADVGGAGGHVRDLQNLLRERQDQLLHLPVEAGQAGEEVREDVAGRVGALQTLHHARDQHVVHLLDLRRALLLLLRDLASPDRQHDVAEAVDRAAARGDVVRLRDRHHDVRQEVVLR